MSTGTEGYTLTGRAAALAALERIKEHPEEWDQEHWTICGTKFCFAGHVALAAGCEYDKDMGLMRTPEGELRYIEFCARDILGIPGYGFMYHPLFHGGNTLEELARRIDDYLPEEAP